jgi:hypothetical protein
MARTIFKKVDQPLIHLGVWGFYFNTNLLKAADIFQHISTAYVDMRHNKELNSIDFEFFVNSNSQSGVPINNNGGQYYAIVSKDFRELVMQQYKVEPLQFNGYARKWRAFFCPNFDTTIEKDQNGKLHPLPNKNLTGVYRYIKYERNPDGSIKYKNKVPIKKVFYVGRGKLHSRFTRVDRQKTEWTNNYDCIEYAVLNEFALEKYWEAILIKKYQGEGQANRNKTSPDVPDVTNLDQLKNIYNTTDDNEAG